MSLFKKKIGENNSYVFSKNCFLFHFIFKSYLQKNNEQLVRNFLK